MKNIFLLLLALSFLWSISLSGESTLIIQNQVYLTDTLAHFKVGPGTRYTSLELKGISTLRAYFLEVDAKNPYIQFNSLLGKDSTITPERISTAAMRHTQEGHVYLAGTNADFFVTSGKVGLPINGNIISGEIGRIPHKSRPMIGFDRKNNPFLDVMCFAAEIENGKDKYPIFSVNEERGSDQLIVYNQYNGNYTHTNNYGTEVLVELLSPLWQVNESLNIKVLAVYKDRGNSFIPKNKMILSGHGSAQEFLNQLRGGDVLTTTLNYDLSQPDIDPRLVCAVGGDRVILQEGKVLDNDWAERHPRTALGYSTDFSKVIFLVVDGRSADSDGVTTKQLADIIRSAGAANAINLDGGGSSGMYIRDFGMMNHCSDGNERSVANGIFVVSTAPIDNQITEILSKEKRYTLPYYGSIKPTILAYNQFGVLVDKDVQGFIINCDPAIGHVDESGFFIASGKEEGNIYVSYQGCTTEIMIQRSYNNSFKCRLDSVVIDNRKDYALEIFTEEDNKQIPIDPSVVDWRVENPEICKVEQGIIQALANGRTRVCGELNGFKDTLWVKTEIPAERKLLAKEWNISEEWTLSASSNIKNLTLSQTENKAGVVNFDYENGRFPYVRLCKTSPLFGLPDSIQFVFNSGKFILSDIQVMLRSHDVVVGKQFKIAPVLINEDAMLRLSINDVVSNKEDRNSYPLNLDFISFNVAPGNPVGKYAIMIKEIATIYDNVVLNIFPAHIQSRLRVYPNPVQDDQVMIEMECADLKEVTLSLCTLDGILIRKVIYQQNPDQTIHFYLKGIRPGSYLLNIDYDGVRESSKLIIQ